jgi:hypothetical protein
MADIYVAVSGNDTTGDGSVGNPYATWAKGYSIASAGDAVLIQPGTYTLATATGGPVFDKAGSSSARISVRGHGGLAVLNCANIADPVGNSPFGLKIANSWHVLEDMRITGVRQVSASNFPVGVQLIDFGAGCNNNVLRRIESDSHGGTGIYATTGGTVSNNVLEDCYSHHNYDQATSGSNADGFGFGFLGVSCSGNVLRRCQSEDNSDDGYDVFDTEAAVTFDHCVALRNGYVPGTSTAAGNGIGFKLGPSTANPQHIVTRNVAAYNRVDGFKDNNASGPQLWYNNTALGNGNRQFNIEFSVAHVLRNNLALGTIFLHATSDDQYNSWNTPPGITITSADFASLNGVGDHNFARITTGSSARNVGVDVGLWYSGSAPDLGAYETYSEAEEGPMAVATKTSVKQHFETGDVPTQAQFQELIDSYQDHHGILQAIATAAQGGATGVVIIEGSADATTAAIGAMGKRIITAETTASVATNFNLVTTDTTQTITGAKTFDGLVRISAAVTIVNTKSPTALRIIATDATAGSVNAPVFVISREYDSGAWANNDITGGIRWQAVASANSAIYTLANQYMQVHTALASATDARLTWSTRVGSDLTNQVSIGGSAGGMAIMTSGNPLGTGTLNADRVYSHNGRQLVPHLQAFAWATHPGTGTVSLTNSINIASITDNGTGDYSLVFSTAASDANYGVQIYVSQSAASSPPTTVSWSYLHTTTAGGCRYVTVRGTPTASAVDHDRITVTIWDDNPSQGTRAA